MPLPPSSGFQEQDVPVSHFSTLDSSQSVASALCLRGSACREGVQVSCCSGLCWLWGKRGRRSCCQPLLPSRPPPGNSAFKSPDHSKCPYPSARTTCTGRSRRRCLSCMPSPSAVVAVQRLLGISTPFSYAVPGQANEIVLIEWGNNPIELLINDKVSPLGRPPPFPFPGGHQGWDIAGSLTSDHKAVPLPKGDGLALTQSHSGQVTRQGRGGPGSCSLWGSPSGKSHQEAARRSKHRATKDQNELGLLGTT